MSRWKNVGQFDSFIEGQAVVVDFEYESAALYRVGERIFAIEDRCSHDDGPLAEGVLAGCAVECPRHGAQFDLKTGDALSMPASEAVATYAIKIEAGTVYIEVPED